MRQADIILDIHKERGSKGLPLERVYKHLLNPELYLRAYGKIYRNTGAMTKGTTAETVDGMSLQKIIGIIETLRQERYRWEPVRRTEIPKPNGKTRPLGIPTWSDKLVQEVIRSILEPYYEQRFSNLSHGFRPERGCHTALTQVRRTWKGTTWFIEGDIKGCFDNIDHAILLEIIRRDIHDERLTRLIGNLLGAGYMEDWRYYDTPSGTPQGGIVSPLLANIYLNDLDRYVEDTLIPAYRAGDRRRVSPEYTRIGCLIATARKQGDRENFRRLTQERRKLSSYDPNDPNYRRLRYVRYADDFLLGFVGPKKEAEEIRSKLGDFLQQKLKLTLSPEKTLITHARDSMATFLGYEVNVMGCGNLIARDGRRATNGAIGLWMPRKVVGKYRDRFCVGGKPRHRAELTNDTDYAIVQRYQAIMRGVYYYYCMAINVSKRMAWIKWMLRVSLLKTLASKHKISTRKVRRRYQTTYLDRRIIRVVVERPGKEPLIAVFGGIPFERKPEGMGTTERSFETLWFSPGGSRSEVVQRMLVGKCELCGVTGEPTEVHHIRKLADIDRPGRRPKAPWERIMSARKRKTLVLCKPCHRKVTHGRYDGPAI